jgi:hypothetical protein
MLILCTIAALLFSKACAIDQGDKENNNVLILFSYFLLLLIFMNYFPEETAICWACGE